MRICRKCDREFQVEEFPTSYRHEGKTYRRHVCIECQRTYVDDWQSKNPDAKRRAYVRRNWNMSLEEYDALISTGCEVCGTMEQLVIDHDHSCCPDKRNTCGMCIRGVLCNRHNLAEGSLRGDPTEAYALAEYMKKHWKGEDLS